jgi:acetoin utilization deacetylase AcuC-like enzyme
LTTACFYDERCLAHDNGSMIIDERAAGWLDVPHVERPERLSRTWSVLERAGVASRLKRLESRAATRAELELVHTAALVDAIEAACARREFASVGPEARVGPDSWVPALMATGGLLAVTDSVLDGEADNGFALIRPPGHHSTADTAMGFCLFNCVAVAARHAQRRDAVERVAIVDWDVHHGNGTEAVFYDDATVLFVSLHQDGLYPAGAGALEHTGAGAGEGFTVNVPLPAGSGDAGYLLAWDEVVAPRLAAFEPDLLLISAGQDPAAGDPLGRMSVTTEGFRALTARAREASRDLCEGRLAVTLEGGYSLDHAPFCNLAIVEALAGLEPALAADPLEQDVPAAVRDFERAAVDRAVAAHAR